MTHEQDEPLSYWTALARSVFEEDIYRLMEKKKLSQAGLAQELAVSDANISRMLRGSNNYQLTTMAKIARVLDAVLEVRLADEKSETTRVLSFADAAFIDDRASQRELIDSVPGCAARLYHFPEVASGLHATLGAENVKDSPSPPMRLSSGVSGG